MKGRILSIAGSDSGGGAGIQADIKAITALGGYAMTAVTALTAQNTHGVHGVEVTHPDFVALQIRTACDDFGVDAIKTGMLVDEAIVDRVADTIEGYSGVPLVVDPVMVAKGGAKLLAPGAIAALFGRLIPMATVLTPNIPEAELLLGRTIRSVDDMIAGAHALRERGANAVVLKGGHLESDMITDVLLDANGVKTYAAPRIATRHTHGTGCTLASAIATGLAQGLDLDASLRRARSYLRAAIEGAPGYGTLAGPVDHAAGIDPNRFA